MKIRAIVIDDEFFNRDLISKLVEKTHPDFQIIGTAEDIDDAFHLINTLKPDLIFLDIKMPGGNGFDLLRKFEIQDFEVVFITGFDDYAIQAFEFNALDYILKPIDTSKLEKTLLKVQSRINNKLSITSNLKEITQLYKINSTSISKIPLHDKDKVILLPIEDIISIETQDGCTTFKDRSNNKYLSSKQLCDFEFIFEDIAHFVKINRSTYINIKFLKHYSKNQICVLTLTNGALFEVSRRKKGEILAILDRK